jgi:hypothetical protein
VYLVSVAIAAVLLAVAVLMPTRVVEPDAPVAVPAGDPDADADAVA